MATGNVHKKFVKIGPVVPDICSPTDRHTHRHTHTNKLIAMLRSPTGAELKTLTTRYIKIKNV